MASRWSDDTLLAARREGDPEADAFVERVLTARAGDGGLSRGGYNHLLDLAGLLVAHPELAIVGSSNLRRGLDRAAEAAPFFEPAPAPDWVDEAKLALATSLWRSDSILCIAVLYAASLPACYLMQKGVPALYQTEKLAEHKYVFQRIYETGLMLDSVMRPGGLTVTRDAEPNADAEVVAALRRVDPHGQWTWRHHRLARGAPGAAAPPDPEAVRRELRAARHGAARYLWGEGFIAARKVRFLHAAMRLMLLNPDQVRRAGAAPPDGPRSFMEEATHRPGRWDVERLGVPINQEDLAFVLLTFGYLIPKGMETWGRAVPVEQKEAFLHLWRVIGHLMGIRADLTTDRLDEAEALYEQIVRRNGGPSDAGRILTSAVMDFLRSYLPPRLGIDRVVPAALIVDQLGPERAAMIVAQPDFDAARRPLARAGHGVLKTGARLYYWLRQHVLVHLPIVGPGVATLTSHAADTLIDSWRDSFRRKPFYIPSDATTWVAERGITPQYEATLMAWRRRLFDTLAAGLGSLVVSGLAFCLALVFLLAEMRTPRNAAFTVSVIGLVLALAVLRWGVPSVAARRPRLEDHEGLAEASA
jgi:hypothetical protein